MEQSITVAPEHHAHEATNTSMFAGESVGMCVRVLLFFGRGGEFIGGNSTSALLNFTNTGLTLVYNK